MVKVSNRRSAVSSAAGGAISRRVTCRQAKAAFFPPAVSEGYPLFWFCSGSTWGSAEVWCKSAIVLSVLEFADTRGDSAPRC